MRDGDGEVVGRLGLVVEDDCMVVAWGASGCFGSSFACRKRCRYDGLGKEKKSMESRASQGSLRAALFRVPRCLLGVPFGT